MPLHNVVEEEPKKYAPIAKQRREFYHGAGRSKFTKKEKEDKERESNGGYESETEKIKRIERSVDWDSYNR